MSYASKPRASIFVDAANMFYAQRENGWHLDYKRVYDFLSEEYQITGAYYFTSTPSYENTDQIKAYRQFRKALIHIGYTVVDKEVHIIHDKETGEKLLKGNLDVEITLKMLASMPSYDVAIILGGDRDFIPVVDHLRNSGKAAIIYGRRQMTALDLINVANKFIDLNDIRNQIEKK